MKRFFKIQDCLLFCLFSVLAICVLAETTKEATPTQETTTTKEPAVAAASSSTHADFEDFLWQRDSNEAHKVIFKTVDKPKMAQGYIGKSRMFASRNIEEGETVYVYSLKDRNQVISAPEALQDPVFGPAIDPYVARDEKQQKGTFALYDDQIIKLYLMYLSHTKPAQWKPYLDMLPKNLDLPVYWTDEEIEELKGSQLYSTDVRVYRLKLFAESTHKLRVTIRRDYDELFPKLTELLPELFLADVYTYDLFAWSFNTYSARMWYKAKAVFNPVFPLMEVFNYKEEPAVRFEEKDGSLYLIATEDIEKGEEIFVNDGLIGNRELLEFYGFVITNNPNDTVTVAVAIDPDDNGQSYSITTAEIPSDLIFALRVYHVSVYDYEDAESALKDELVSSQNELAVAQTIMDMCQKTLKNYPTTNKFDKELLKEKLPRRLYNAVILRRSEKKILYKTLDKTKEILVDLQRSWEYRSMDVPGEALKAYPAEPDQIL